MLVSFIYLPIYPVSILTGYGISFKIVQLHSCTVPWKGLSHTTLRPWAQGSRSHVSVRACLSKPMSFLITKSSFLQVSVSSERVDCLYETNRTCHICFLSVTLELITRFSFRWPVFIYDIYKLLKHCSMAQNLLRYCHVLMDWVEKINMFIEITLVILYHVLYLKFKTVS